MFRQASLFPDAFEVVDQALSALDRMDLEEAWRCVEEARRRDPGLVELAPMRACIAWLRAQLGDGPPTDERLAALFAQVPEAVRAGRLDRSSAARIDEFLARQGLARARAGAFLDPAERVHRGALFLVLGRPREAHDLLRESLTSGGDGRADLWGYHGDACLGTERPEEANAAYVRALVLGAREVDLHRLRNERLRVLFDELRGDRPEPEARERLLVHAWLAGATGRAKSGDRSRARDPEEEEEEEEGRPRSPVGQGQAALSTERRGRPQGQGAGLQPPAAPREHPRPQPALEGSGPGLDPRSVRTAPAALQARATACETIRRDDSGRRSEP